MATKTITLTDLVNSNGKSVKDIALSRNAVCFGTPKTTIPSGASISEVKLVIKYTNFAQHWPDSSKMDVRFKKGSASAITIPIPCTTATSPIEKKIKITDAAIYDPSFFSTKDEWKLIMPNDWYYTEVYEKTSAGGHWIVISFNISISSLAFEVTYDEVGAPKPPTYVSVNDNNRTIEISGGSAGSGDTFKYYSVTVKKGSSTLKTFTTKTGETKTTCAIPAFSSSGSLTFEVRTVPAKASQSDPKTITATLTNRTQCGVPTGLNIEDVIIPASTATLNWIAGTPGAGCNIIGYEIQKSTDGKTFSLYKTVELVTSVVVDTPETSSDFVYYKIKTKSDYPAYDSNFSTVYTIGFGEALDPPYNVRSNVSVARPGAVVTVEFDDDNPSEYVSGYQLFESFDGLDFTSVKENTGAKVLRIAVPLNYVNRTIRYYVKATSNLMLPSDMSETYADIAVQNIPLTTGTIGRTNSIRKVATT